MTVCDMAQVLGRSCLDVAENMGVVRGGEHVKGVLGRGIYVGPEVDLHFAEMSELALSTYALQKVYGNQGSPCRRNPSSAASPPIPCWHLPSAQSYPRPVLPYCPRLPSAYGVAARTFQHA